MRKNLLHKYHRSLLAEFKNNYANMVAKMDVTSIHDLRLNNKKINALFFLLESLNPSQFNFKKDSKELKKFFRKIGKIRDYHVAQIVLKKYENYLDQNFNDCLKLFRSDIVKNKRNFKNWLKTHDIKPFLIRQDKLVKATYEIEDEVLKSKGNTLVNKLKREIIFENDRNYNVWHKRRILLKKLRFLIEALKFSLKDWNKFDQRLKRVKLLEELLGDWHDLVITETLLKDHLSTTISNLTLLKKALKKDRGFLISTVKFYLMDSKTL